MEQKAIWWFDKPDGGILEREKSENKIQIWARFPGVLGIHMERTTCQHKLLAPGQHFALGSKAEV